VCDIGGFSPGTPDSGRKAYDLLIQAEAGLAGVTGSADSGPSRVGISISDISTGQAAYAAILEALLRRGRSGQGSHIQLSLFDTIAEYVNVPYLARRYGGVETKRVGLAHPSIAPYGVFQAIDGAILIAIQNEREWAMFCERVLGDASLASDPRFDRNTARVANRQAVDELVQRRIGTRTVAALCALLDDARIAYGRVSTMGELITHRSVTTVSVETPAGPVELMAPPVSVDGERPHPGAVPALGQHTEALRREFGGQEQRQAIA
jgi:crotonobetainyl-CoA:carnitine CoA-transferase CaiB-like acyl-CoA transferase